MSAASPAPEPELAAEALVTAALDALSGADGDAFAELVTEDVVIATERSSREGREAAQIWAARRYDYLNRRYRITDLAHDDRCTVVDARVEYLWKGEEDVADSSPVTLHFELRGDRIARLELRD